MKKKNLVPLLGVAFIVALVTTGIFYGLFVGQLNSAPNAAGIKIIVATRTLSPGREVSDSDVREVPWFAPSAPAGTFTKADDVVGKIVVDEIPENEVVRAGHVGSTAGGDPDSGSLGIPEGMRAVSLQVQDSAGVVAMLKPGHKVDVQVVGNPPGSRGDPQVRTFMENLRVLSVPKDARGARPGSQIVAVLATPREASILAVADSTAKVRLLLRNPIDQKRDNLDSVTMGTVFSERSAPQAAGAPPATGKPSR